MKSDLLVHIKQAEGEAIRHEADASGQAKAVLADARRQAEALLQEGRAQADFAYSGRIDEARKVAEGHAKKALTKAGKDASELRAHYEAGVKAASVRAVHRLGESLQ